MLLPRDATMLSWHSHGLHHRTSSDWHQTAPQGPPKGVLLSMSESNQML